MQDQGRLPVNTLQLAIHHMAPIAAITFLSCIEVAHAHEPLIWALHRWSLGFVR